MKTLVAIAIAISIGVGGCATHNASVVQAEAVAYGAALTAAGVERGFRDSCMIDRVHQQLSEVTKEELCDEWVRRAAQRANQEPITIDPAAG